MGGSGEEEQTEGDADRGMAPRSKGGTADEGAGEITGVGDCGACRPDFKLSLACEGEPVRAPDDRAYGDDNGRGAEESERDEQVGREQPSQGDGSCGGEVAPRERAS